MTKATTENAAISFTWGTEKPNIDPASGNSRSFLIEPGTGSELMNSSAVVLRSLLARICFPRSVKTAIAVNAPQ